MSPHLTLPETLARLQELQDLLADATPGPWEAFADGTIKGSSENPEVGTVKSWNAALVAAAVNALPDLLAMAGACLVLRATVARLDEVLKDREFAASMTNGNPTWVGGVQTGILGTVSDVREVLKVYKDYVEKEA